MGVFDDVSRFLEDRLDEFLKNNPHLELQAILEQVRDEEKDTLKLIRDLEAKKQQLEQEILSLAQDIQTWHARVTKAKSAGRLDLAQAAQEREASLLHQGNQVWGQMEGTKKRITQSQELLSQLQQRKQEVQTKITQMKAQTSTNSATTGWNQGFNPSSYNKATDPLETQFRNWELDEELQQIKRNL